MANGNVPSIMDLLLGPGGAGMGAGGPSPFAPGTAPPMPGAPDPIADLLRPVEPEPLGRGAGIATALADAINAALAVKLGRPHQPSATARAVQQRQAAADRQTRANMIQYQEQVRKQAEETRQAEREEDREDRQREARKAQFKERFYRAKAEERDRVFRIEMMKQEQVFRKELATLQASDNVLDRQIATEQRKKMDQARLDIVALKSNLPELLNTMSPAQIRESAMDDLDAMGLDGEARVTAEMFFEAKVGHLLEAAAAKAEAQQPADRRQQSEIPIEGGLLPIIQRAVDFQSQVHPFFSKTG